MSEENENNEEINKELTNKAAIRCFPGNKSISNNIVVQRAEKHSTRDVLFSSVRYTSGEVLVYSSASALLVKEYSEPGFIEFIMSLCGGGLPKKSSEDEHQYGRQKVFSLSIPENVFKEKEEVEYEVIFQQIVALGATPLGLYRSGKAGFLPEVIGNSLSTEKAQNTLPYVYTLPQMKTLVHKHDAVYVLYDPSKIDLYRTWKETEFTKEKITLISGSSD